MGFKPQIKGLDYYEETDTSGFLKKDQTVPETITGDTPKLDTLKSKSILGTDADGKIIEGTPQKNRQITVVIDGAGAAPAADTKTYVRVPYSGTITGWHIAGDVSGSCVIDVWKDTFGNFPPTVADTIAGTEKPTLSEEQTASDTDLTTWTTSVTAGDWIGINVDSASTLTKIWLAISVEASS